MVYKTYISKFNTIISGSKINTGLNPIAELVYGHDTVVSRILMYFDHNKVKELMNNGTMVDMSKMKHTLHITNAGSIDFTQLHQKETSSINFNTKMRATSFDIIFFLIPKPWDRGKGFDYSRNYFNYDFYSCKVIDATRLTSEDGCNWFQRMNGLPWDDGEKDELDNEVRDKIVDEFLLEHDVESIEDLTKEEKLELYALLEEAKEPKYAPGIFTNDKLSKEYDKFSAGEESIVIARQHFDVGNENLNIDITDVFNKFLDGELDNYGIGMAFSPMLEASESEYENYIGFLTDKTNTFFEPFVETRYEDVVSDDRSNFVLGKRNRLYLYCTIGDHLEDLSLNPTVTIRNGDGEIIRDSAGREMTWIMSKRQSKGIYYIDVKLSRSDFEPDIMLYDTWTNIQYQGTLLDDVELDFVVKQSANYFNIGNSISTTDITFSPVISGIKEKEQIKRGDIRKLVIQAKPSYTNNTAQLLDTMDLRLYVKDGTREIDVIEWDTVNKAFLENYYMVDTNILIPQRYFVDIRIKYGMNSIIHHDVLSFDIVDDLNNKYA
jgi:hypothetical protein